MFYALMPNHKKNNKNELGALMTKEAQRTSRLARQTFLIFGWHLHVAPG